MTSAFDILQRALADRYRLERELGAGGMATVYLAQDLRHDREVAIKVVHPDLGAALGAERFLAEIKTTAKLQHPHILPLLDSGAAQGQLFYVMPYVRGETLRARLQRETQLPVAEALQLAREVADALAEAHAQGIVHRDIKPENVLLQGGHAIVADFGIALAVQQAGGARMTQTGLSLGTPQYMAPEQAMGDKALDHRVDQYALAAMTYEMLAGEPPHTGPNAQTIVAKILSEPVRPVTVLRPAVPAAVDEALRTALAKLPADRFGSVREFAEALRAGSGSRAAAGSAVSAAALATRPARRRVWGLSVAAVLAAAAAGWMLGRQGASAAGGAAPAVRLALLMPEGMSLSGSMSQLAVSLSADGREVLYAGRRAGDAGPRLYRQRIDSDSAVVIPNGDGLGQPSLSPDGEWIAAITPAGGVVLLPARGGTPDMRPVVAASAQTFLAWHPDGSLYMTRVEAPEILRIDPRTRQVTVAVKVPPPGVWLDQILPDGKRALCVVAGGPTNTGRSAVLDLATGTLTTLLDRDVNGIRYSDGSLLAWLADGSLLAYPFDLAAATVTGDPVPLARDVATASIAGLSQLYATPGGALVYGETPPAQLVLVDRAGRERPLTAQRGAWHNPRFSPDGRLVAADRATESTRDVWTIGTADGALTRATTARTGHDAIWTPDGASLVFLSDESGVLGLRRTRIGSLASAESLYTAPGVGAPSSWLPDGTTLLTSGIAKDGPLGIEAVAQGGRGPVRALDLPPGGSGWPAASPDGHWLAYATMRSGRTEVVVRAMATGAEQMITTGGGTEPLWSRDGRTLYWRARTASGDALLSAPMTATGVDVAAARALFAVGLYGPAIPHRNYDIAPDGATFVFVKTFEIGRVVVVPNVRALIAGLPRRAAP